MPLTIKAALAAFLLLAFFVAPLAASGDPDPNCPLNAPLIDRLHTYAYLEHRAFRPAMASPECSNLTPAGHGRILYFFPPVEAGDDSYWQQVLADLSFDSGDLAVYVLADSPSHSRYFLTCQTAEPYQIVLSFVINIQVGLQFIASGGRLPQYAVHILGEAATSDPNIVNSIDDPNVSVQRLRDLQSNEDLFLIRGVQSQQLAQNIATVLNDNCPFELAVAAVKHLATELVPDNCLGSCSDPRESNEPATLSVVGHSLGGTAVQYIAGDYANDPYSYGNIVMDSYSFNSYGAEYPNTWVSAKRNFSYCTAGDWACFLIGGDRNQPGTPVIYEPGNGRSATHGIASVQQQLCNCRSGIGHVIIDEP
ncbi:MAG: hypothetical protein OXQ31_02445 [Spirochaetaceae bacterium]|nr:hypothetical protein [Spirochaetaceae bacterium]